MASEQQYNKTNPFISSIKERYNLCLPGSQKRTCHVVLDLSASGITYKVGDSVGVFPENDPFLVQKTIQVMKASDQVIIVDRNGHRYSLHDFLSKKASIAEFSRKFLSEVSSRQTNPIKKQQLETLLAEGNKELLKDYQLHHDVWEVLQENFEVVFSAQEICSLLMPLLPRLYSVASSQSVVGEEVHLTVALLKYHADQHSRLGVCTHYLCDLAPFKEAVIPIYIQPHHGFTLPENEDASIIMVGPGTGVAPFRAFMQEREARSASGKNWLFFGECHQAYDFFYQDYWEKLVSQEKLRLTVAFSRDQPHKIYVQHRMLEHAAELYRWLEEGAYFYVCGDADHMAKDVDSTLHQIVQEQGKKSDTEAKAYIKQLRAEKRYLRDVY